MRIVNRLKSAWASIYDWINEPLVWRFRRIDAVLLGMGIVCVAYYGWYNGWRGALMGGAMYVMVVVIALWML